MLNRGPAKKVTIFVNEDTQHGMTSLNDSILTFLLHKGVSGATATRAMAGFGSNRQMHTPKVEALAEHLPVRIEFVETAEKVDELLPALYEMVTDGLIEVQDTTVVKAARKERKPAPQPAHHGRREPARLLRIYIGEADQWNGEPLYDAIVKQLRMTDVAGATVYRGILGYGAKGHTHKESFWHRSRDLPVMISVIDSAGKIAAAAEAIEAMMGDGLIVVSDVEMIRLVRGAEASDAAV